MQQHFTELVVSDALRAVIHVKMAAFFLRPASSPENRRRRRPHHTRAARIFVQVERAVGRLEVLVLRHLIVQRLEGEVAEVKVRKTARASQAASARTWLASQLAWGERVRQAAESRSRRVDGNPRIGDLACIAADAASDLYVVSTASAGYIGLVDLSDPDTEARFLPDRIATISELRASSPR